MGVMKMNLEEIKAFIESNKEDEGVKTFLDGFKTEVQAPLSKDTVSKWIEEQEDGKGFAQSLKDAHFTKSLDTWKQNNLQKLIDEEMQKRNPNKSEAELKVDQLLKELEDQKREALHEKLKNKAVGILSDKQLPLSLVGLFVDMDEETTTKNIESFEKEFKAHVQAEVEKRFAKGGKAPQDTKSDISLYEGKTWSQLSSTEKGKLLDENAELYEKLRKENK
jgi:polyhydroxyalkanoate synthesis regulator phasin